MDLAQRALEKAIDRSLAGPDGWRKNLAAVAVLVLAWSVDEKAKKEPSH